MINVALASIDFSTSLNTSTMAQKAQFSETVSHYLLECNEFDTARELMRKKLFETCGIIHLDLNLLLDARQDDDYKDWRSFILCY